MTDPTRKKIFWSSRFRVLKERERTHVSKFLIDILPANVLAQLGIAEFGYVLENIDQSELLGYSQDPIFKYVVTGCNRR